MPPRTSIVQGNLESKPRANHMLAGVHSACVGSHTSGVQMSGAPDVQQCFPLGVGVKAEEGRVAGWTTQLLHACAPLWLKDRAASSKCRRQEEAGRAGGRDCQGKCTCLQKPHQAVTGAGYLVQSPLPECEQGAVRLRHGSTQHIHGKHFIFLP